MIIYVCAKHAYYYLIIEKDKQIMKNRILKLEENIPRLKGSKNILPLKVECLEWELRALKAEAKLNNLLKSDIIGNLTFEEVAKVANAFCDFNVTEEMIKEELKLNQL